MPELQRGTMGETTRPRQQTTFLRMRHVSIVMRLAGGVTAMTKYECHCCHPKPPCSIDILDHELFTETEKKYCPFDLTGEANFKEVQA